MKHVNKKKKKKKYTKGSHAKSEGSIHKSKINYTYFVIVMMRTNKSKLIPKIEIPA